MLQKFQTRVIQIIPNSKFNAPYTPLKLGHKSIQENVDGNKNSALLTKMVLLQGTFKDTLLKC